MTEKLDEVYIYHMERTLRQMRKYISDELNKYEIKVSSEQWVILKRLHEKNGLNQKELSELTYKDPASMTRILDLLEKDGLIERRKNPQDRREYRIYLQKKGEEFVTKILPVAETIRKQGLKNLRQSEVEQLNTTLEKIYINFS